MIKDICFRPRVLLAVLLSGLSCASVSAAIEVLGVQYQQDNSYLEFNCYWNDRNYPTSCPPRALGGNVHVYVKNTGASAVSFDDVTLAGHSLKTVIKQNPGVHDANSIFFYWDNPPADIMNAGEPVWYKGDPATIPAGGVGQAVIRLRAPPTTPTVTVGVQTTGGSATTNITVDANAAQLASVGFSQDRTKVYLHWRRSGGAAPTTVRMNGTNVNAITTTVGDPTMNFAASVIQLTTPLPFMSYHVFQGVYADGKTATASIRAWSQPFIHATWGTFPDAETSTATAQAWIDEATEHSFNAAQNQMTGGALGAYLSSAAGQAYAEARGGYRVIVWDKFQSTNPLLCFLKDEPDAEEASLENNMCGVGLKLPCDKSPMAILAMREIAKGEAFRADFPLAPTVVNMDGAFRPENSYAWGQVADTLQIDPYYQRRLSDVYWRDQHRIPLFTKATYIYANARAATSAAEPNRSHLILYSCEWTCDAAGECDPEYLNQTWPFPTPESKRIEAYYSLAAGVKGLSYWWFKPGNPSNGLGDQSKPTARALWKGMGVYGNEIKTASHLLVNSHPVDLPITPGANVWARALAVRTDTLILIVVNDNYYNDLAACHYTPVNNATVTITLPTWMQPSPTAFEIAAGGLKAVGTQVNGNQLQMNLGTLQLTKLIVLTKDPQLPTTINQRYNTQVRSGLCAVAPEYCTNSAPAIVVQPQSQTVLLADSPMFAVAASGTPSPSYQWRFNNVNLTGATGDTYTRTNAQAGHTGGYTVVVSNSLASVTSVVAMLTVSTNGIAPSIFTPPQNQSVPKGENATFTVTANGTDPLNYQWRFNNANLVGATSSSYTRFNAQTNDAGQYTVFVTNAAGAVTSAPATLTVTVPILCTTASLANADFEGGNTSGVATGWTGYQRAPNPTTVWTIQTASPPTGGGLQYQQIANTSATGGGGVRQDVTGCVIGATYQISGWMRGNSALATCTVKCSPTASTSWATAIDLDPPQTYSAATWTNFNGTVVATGTSMTIWLDGQTTGTGQNKAECFDSVTVTCLGATAPPVLEYKQQGANLIFSWPTNVGNYGLIAATNVSGAVWNGVLPSPTVVNGTNIVTNAISGERKFYRLTRPPQ